MKAVITDHPFPSLELTKDIFSRNGIELEVLQTKDQDVIIAAAKSAEAVIVGMARFDEKVINALDRCKVIVRLGVGFDNVDLAAATARKIIVVNIPDFCTEEVSDHAIAVILLVSRRLRQGQQAVRDGKWGPMAIDFTSFRRVNQLTVGLFGFGRIARCLAEKARGLKMNCVAFDPFVTKEAMAAVGVTKVELPELLAKSDFLSLHSPLTPETENSFGLEQFRAMKRTAWLINTARGPVVREAELVQALDEGLIAGAALDVMAKEPPDKSHPLLGRENVIITPHMGCWTLDARDDLQRKGAEEVVRAVKGQTPINVVNRAVLAKLGTGAN